MNQPCKFIFQCSCSTSQLNISSTVPINRKPTESTIPLPKSIAYAFHRTRLPLSVAYHSLCPLSRLKSRYPAASCAFGHCLFLTSYMVSSNTICDNAHLNKVSASHKTITHTTMTNILNLVLMSLPSALVTVNCQLHFQWPFSIVHYVF